MQYRNCIARECPYKVEGEKKLDGTKWGKDKFGDLIWKDCMGIQFREWQAIHGYVRGW